MKFNWLGTFHHRKLVYRSISTLHWCSTRIILLLGSLNLSSRILSSNNISRIAFRSSIDSEEKLNLRHRMEVVTVDRAAVLSFRRTKVGTESKRTAGANIWTRRRHLRSKNMKKERERRKLKVASHQSLDLPTISWNSIVEVGISQTLLVMKFNFVASSMTSSTKREKYHWINF